MITGIEIKNFTSIDTLYISPTSKNCILGKNGTGKSNLLFAIDYFYKNLSTKSGCYNKDFFDNQNYFNDEISISITYELSKVLGVLQWSTENYLSEMYLNLKNIIGGNTFIKVTMVQYKDGTTIFNQDDSILYFLMKAFPVYILDVRNIDLADWKTVWDLLGDSTFFNNANKNEYHQEFRKFIQNKFPFTHEQIFKVENELSKSGININELDSKNRNIMLLQSFFEGTVFKYKDYKLNYYSSGMSSINYIKVFLTLIRVNSSFFPISSPIVLLDEPELGLHPQYVDILSEEIEKISNNTQIFLTSHSPRLIRNAFIHMNVSIFNVSIRKGHSFYEKMSSILEEGEKNKYLLTEREASMYFSSRILFVEGKTELEFFKLPNMIKMFPHLKEIEIIDIAADASMLNLVNPKLRNFSAQFLVLVDMDKIINRTDTGFELNNDVINPLSSKKNDFKREMFYYTEKREQTLLTRKKLHLYLSKNFTIDENWHYFKGSKFWNFVRQTKKYCLEYNTYCLETTIEGAFINKNTLDSFKEWAKINMKKNYELISETLKKTSYNDYYKKKIELTLYRISVEGKFEDLYTKRNVLKKLEKKKKKNSEEIALEYFLKKYIPSKKASGWVELYLDYYIEKYGTAKFSQDFKELYAIINILR